MLAGPGWRQAYLKRPSHCCRAGCACSGTASPAIGLLHGVSLAQAMLLTRRVDGAVEATDQALTLTAGQDSDRVRSRLGELRGALAASKGSQAIAAADGSADLIQRVAW